MAGGLRQAADGPRAVNRRRGATTHPAVLAAVLELARDFGAEVVVGDGPAVGVPGRVFEATGISDVCRRFNLKPVDFNREEGSASASTMPTPLGKP